jgi:hypothetical protein
MNLLAFTWTDIWLGIGRAFQWMFQFMPAMGFWINLLVWLIISYCFFYWVIKQARDTKKAQSEGRLI